METNTSGESKSGELMLFLRRLSPHSHLNYFRANVVWQVRNEGTSLVRLGTGYVGFLNDRISRLIRSTPNHSSAGPKQRLLNLWQSQFTVCRRFPTYICFSKVLLTEILP